MSKRLSSSGNFSFLISQRWDTIGQMRDTWENEPEQRLTGQEGWTIKTRVLKVWISSSTRHLSFFINSSQSWICGQMVGFTKWMLFEIPCKFLFYIQCLFFWEECTIYIYFLKESIIPQFKPSKYAIYGTSYSPKISIYKWKYIEVRDSFKTQVRILICQ